MKPISRSISIMVTQFPISLDVSGNRAMISSLLAQARPDTLVVMPEGALSGYAADPAFLDDIDPVELDEALVEIRKEVEQQGIHLVFGSCLLENGRWYNAGMYLGPNREYFIYRKINLATSERGVFTPGSSLPYLDIQIGGDKVRAGIQLCREIRFPEQWQYLARAGVEVFAYLTNHTGVDRMYPVWRSHLISRAAENQRFVLSANNAHVRQGCPSMVVDPWGKVLWEVQSGEIEHHSLQLDLDQVNTWYLDQARRDVVAVQGMP